MELCGEHAQVEALVKALEPLMKRMEGLLDPIDCDCSGEGGVAHICGYPDAAREVERATQILAAVRTAKEKA